VPQLIYVGTNDTLATVLTPGYLNTAIPTYGNIFSENQMAMVYTTDQLTVLLSISTFFFRLLPYEVTFPQDRVYPTL